ncbi:MAG TPA: glycerol kinase GlpK [Treponemataceae bacterium]|nr:glycerol kinase GlpK [Treponemataceae bacterium]
MKSSNSGYILSFDQGTTSSRAILFNHDGAIVAMAQRPLRQYYPEPGWVEQDANEILESQLAVAREAIAKAGIGPEEIASIGITNQRETVVMWDKDSGRPVYRAIVWQCRRSTAICEELVSSGLEDEFRARTGLRLDPYFSGTKLCWLFREIPGLKALAENGEILFGTVDSWLLWNLTGRHETDITNASRTLLFNINDGTWDPMLLSVLGIPPQVLPKIQSSADDFGVTKPEIFGVSIPISGVVGDQQAALFGHACFSPGMAKNTYGTGCFSLLNTGNKPVWSKNNLLTTVAWRIGGKTTYALEGSVFIAGAVIQWLRDEMRFIETAEETEGISRSIPDTNGVYFVPAFVGLGAPYWDPDARGTIVGITRGVTSAHLVRAALESIAYQSEDLIAAMGSDFGKPVESIKADGGATANSFLMQFQADISGRPVLLPEIAESTALGAAYMAGISCGYWDGVAEIENNWRLKRRFEPDMNEKDRLKRLALWHKAVQAAREYKK